VNGSVDGVSTAAAITDPTTTYRHTENIFSEDTMPVWPRSSCITGTWKDNPVLSMSTRTNSKYLSMLHKDSTTPSA